MNYLGKKGRDKVTGFEGVIIANANYLFGCKQYGLAPKAVDGKIEPTQWFDEGRIEIIGEGIEVQEVTGENPGGPNRDSPCHGMD